MDWLDKIISDAEAGEKAPHRALTRPRLRPYLPNKHTLRTTGSGLLILTRGLISLLRKALRAAFASPAKKPPTKTDKPTTEDAKQAPDDAEKKKATPLADMAERAATGALGAVIVGAVGVGAASVAGPHVAPYLPAAAVTGVGTLLVTAFLVAPDAAPKKPAQAPPGAPSAFAQWLLQTIGDRPGIHLQELYPAMRQLPGQEGRTDADLRGALRTLGVPVTRSVRVGAVAGRTGVRRGDIPAIPSPTGEDGVDFGGDAGQAEDSPPLSVIGEGA